MMKATKWILTGAASLAVAGLLFTVPALAQESPETATAPSAQVGWQGRGARGAGVGRMGGAPGAMAPLREQMWAMRDEVRAQVAEKLAITVDELNQALTEGKSLADLAAEKNVALDDLRAIMTEGMKARLDEAVAAGTITQEQADLMLQHHAQNSGACLTGQGRGMMGQGRGMMGPGRGMGQGRGWQANPGNQ